ncbi:hypothetical protein ANAEL_05757 [Anaerolineales bacterium]|nr:hypothetical protein ANAEL_05757 [Anaerolineales bacterium]
MNNEFFDAIKKGDLGKIERLLSITPCLTYEKDENGLSPVMVAAYSHHQKVLNFLSEQAGSLNIFEAAAMGKTNLVLRHIARDSSLTNAYACDGFQPLGLACYFGHYETAENLIKLGAAVNSPSCNMLGAAPIHSATVAGHVKIALLLIRNNANPNARDINGFTPLHIAAQNGDTEMLRALLFNGADMSIRTRKEKLAIDLAMEAGQNAAVKLLKEGITRRFRPRIMSPVNN